MKLSEQEIQEKLKELSGWKIQGEKIEKEFSFEDFPEAIKFVERVAAIAEEEDHHPDIHIFYNKVKIVLFTHDVGGVSKKDIIFAARID